MKSGNYTPNTKRPHQNVRDTSKESYYRLTKRQLNSEAKKVYDYLKINGKSTRRMISEGTGLKINHITKAVYILIDVWKAADEVDKRPCKISGRTSWYVDLVPSRTIIEPAAKNGVI